MVRTTLRSCGFARSLVRELMFWVDTPLLLTALPGVLCQLATANRQRLGDLVAQTIVVEKRPGGRVGSEGDATPETMSQRPLS